MTTTNNLATYDFTRRSVLITGANRGLGKALLEEALGRGASRVYAATRRPFEHSDERVVPIALDLADSTQIRAAVAGIETLDVLVNNAGVGSVGEDLAVLEQRLQVNVLGVAELTDALTRPLRRSRGKVINIGSLAGIANVPVMPAYAVSKAAALSLTQAQRALLAGQNISVHLVIAGPIDTDMSRELEIPKESAASVAAAIFDGVEQGRADIFPDPLSAPLADGWDTGVIKMFERSNAELLPAPDYTISIFVPASPEDCFAAINDPGEWWDGELVGTADVVGGEFTYTHSDQHMSVQRVAALEPGRRVVWDVVASKLGFVDDPEPWTGTSIEFELEAVEGGTWVTMTHHGLTSDENCYDQCSFGWNHVVGRSLEQFIATGEMARF